MKKFLFFTLAVVVACSAAMAAPVDVTTAKEKAINHLMKVNEGKAMAPGAIDATLIKTEMGEKSEAPVFYIFNTETCYIIVSADDRAEEILAVGDEPLLDIENMPDNMRAWLNGYAEQLDWLVMNPDAKVEKTRDFLKNDSHLKAISNVSPMLTCNWDQDAPYYNQCKFTYNNREYQCVTGCPATSAAMVMYFWKWPVAQVGPLASYSSTLDIGSYYSNEVSFTYPSLPATTFDWANMKDTYRSYTTAQANAVATLMRYVGQAEQMMYGVSGSGILTTQSQRIVNMFKTFGYNQNTVRLVSKSNYNETAWANMLQAELAEGRPVVYLGVSSGGGHAFNVDGYRASDNSYHINFGWSGQGNNYCVMNAFVSSNTPTGQAGSETYNQSQQMVIGIEPPEDYFEPTIVANPASLTFSDCYPTRTYTQTFNVRGINLSGNINIAKSGSNVYSVSPTTISAADASNGVDVTVTYAPTAAGNTNATLTLTSSGAPSKTVSITGSAQAATPTLTVNTNSLTFSTAPNAPDVKKLNITGRFITGNVSLTLTDPSGKFTLSQTSIPASQISETNPVEVIVSFESANEGTFNGSVTIASSGAQTQTVSLTGTADNSGSASDQYLDIAKYATIDQAGWNNTYVNNLYVYQEDQTNSVGWLKMPVYGAWTASTQATFNTGTHGQAWIKTNTTTHSASSTQNSGRNGTYYQGTWTANDIHLASGSFFTSASARSLGSINTTGTSEKSVTFYVTNTTAIKLYGRNSRSTATNLSRYPATIKVYECTKTGNGLTEGTTDIANVTPNTTPANNQNATSGIFNYEVTGLDASKIYKVVASCYMSYFYEIAFATPLPAVNVSPSAPSISVGPNQTGTQTVTVTGEKITDDVQITLNDPEGLFSVSPTTIDVIDALAGADVNVTFNGPEEFGEYTATMTLTSGEVSKTVTLTGIVADMGTAHSDYLDIKKYNTLDENDWYSDVCVKPYEYTIDEANECAWLTMPAAVSVYGWAYDEWAWHWANGANADNPFYLYSGIDWDSMDVFRGCSPYFGSMTARVFGPPTLASGSTASANDYALLVYCVTNCDQVKAMCYNVAPDTSHPTEMEIYDITDGWNLDDNTFVGSWQDNTNNSDVVIESEDLDPTKVYAVIVITYQGVVEEMAFRTPVQGTPKLPINVEADPGSTTAEITWTPGENNDGWNLRWRPYVDLYSVNHFWDWPISDGSVSFEGWTRRDYDGDGYQWGFMATDDAATDACLASQSYNNDVGALTPDNWYISPKVKLGGTLNLKAWQTQYGQEILGVYVYQGNQSVTSITAADLVQVGQDVQTTTTETQYSFDLSRFEGTGYIILRHYNCTDGFYLLVDDIQLLVPGGQDEVPEEYEWTYCYDVTSPYTIEGLTPETTYEVQVQGFNEAGVVGNWTESTIFTTLPISSATLATIEGSGTKGETYVISDELIAVHADLVNGMLWCKDQGNASINPSSIIDGQIDFMNDANITGTTGQCGRDWDQSNWVALKFPADQNSSSVLTGSVGKKIKAGTVTGRYIDNSNYTIEVQPVNGNYSLTYNGTLEYTPNVYCVANFVESNLNIGGNTGAVGPHGDHYFFMNPKIQEICEITYAMWDGEMFVTPDNTSIQGAFHVDWSRNAEGTPTLQEGKTYRFLAIVSRPAKLSNLKGGGTPSDNFVVYPANLSGDGNIVTAINGIYTDGYREVVGVEYVNSLGMTSKTPFQGVNIVVTRYSDGSTTSVKKIFK